MGYNDCDALCPHGSCVHPSNLYCYFLHLPSYHLPCPVRDRKSASPTCMGKRFFVPSLSTHSRCQLSQRESHWQAGQRLRFRQRLPYQGSCRADARLRGCTTSCVSVLYYVFRKAILRTTSPSMLRIATSPCRRGLGSPCNISGFARGSPTRGAVEPKARLRGCTTSCVSVLHHVFRKVILRTTSPSMLRIATSPCRRGFGSPCNASGFASGSPLRGSYSR